MGSRDPRARDDRFGRRLVVLGRGRRGPVGLLVGAVLVAGGAVYALVAAIEAWLGCFTFGLF